MNGNPTLLPALLGVAVAGLALAAFLVARSLAERRKRETERRMSGGTAGDSSPELVLPAPAGPKGWAGTLDERFDLMIERTGLKMSAEQALGLMSLTGVALAGAFYLWREQIWLALAGLALGMGVPLAVYVFMYRRFRRRFQEQLPDAFYLLARSLRAGLALDQAIALVGEQGVRPLADEFRRCAGQMHLGLSLSAALQLTAGRLRLTDFNAFVSTVSYYQSAGGNLALMLDRLAASTRDHNQFRGHVLAATAQGRATAVALALAAPLMLLGYALFEPDHVRAFFNSPNGWALLGVAALLEVIGIIWLTRILKIDY